MAEPVDFRATLETAAIEHLDVDEHRTIVIYQQTIFMVIATEGEATAAWEFDVEFWEESPDDLNQDSEEVLATFVDKLIAIMDTARH